MAVAHGEQQRQRLKASTPPDPIKLGWQILT